MGQTYDMTPEEKEVFRNIASKTFAKAKQKKR